jgi:hypothetical protein
MGRVCIQHARSAASSSDNAGGGGCCGPCRASRGGPLGRNADSRANSGVHGALRLRGERKARQRNGLGLYRWQLHGRQGHRQEEKEGPVENPHPRRHGKRPRPAPETQPESPTAIGLRSTEEQDNLARKDQFDEN